MKIFKKILKGIAFYFIAFLAMILFVIILRFSGLNSIFEKIDIQFRHILLSTIGIVYCAGLAFVVAKKKKLEKKPIYILIVILSGLLYVYGGVIMGLIPASYLSTK